MPIIFDGSISATIQVRGRTYTLVGTANLTSASGSSGGGSGSLSAVKLVYHAAFNDALSLGTLGSVVSGGQNLVDDIVEALNLPRSSPSDFKTEWTQLQGRLKAMPAPFGAIYTEVLANVELRITDIELVLDAPAPGNSFYSRGSVALGFGFDCSQIDPSNRTLLGIRLQAIGVKLSVGIQ